MRRIESRSDQRVGEEHDAELAGIDSLETTSTLSITPWAKAWTTLWPKLAAVGLLLIAWQLVVLSGWKPEYVLPGPRPVFSLLAKDLANGKLLRATSITVQRAGIGFAVSLVVGLAVGIVVSSNTYLRRAVGALITGLQTMPSIAWFPLAIVLFQLSEEAIFAVVLLGAAPAIANGIITGIDHIPPLLLSAGRVLGARGVAAYRHIVVPAALPGFVGGLKQGWAFAWRSLMAGELLVIFADKPSLGVQLQMARETSDAEGLLAAMIVILAVGIIVDVFVFRRLDRAVRTRWGLRGSAA